MKIFLIIFVITVSFCLFAFGTWFVTYLVITPFDRPWRLSNKTETIEVTYVNWACDCANFVETVKDKHNPISEPKEDDYMFLEGSDAAAQIPADYYESGHFKYFLRLTGHFYTDKGIPESYEAKTEMKPEKGRVFRYDKIEFVDKGKNNN